MEIIKKEGSGDRREKPAPRVDNQTGRDLCNLAVKTNNGMSIRHNQACVPALALASEQSKSGKTRTSSRVRKRKAQKKEG